MDTWEKKAAYAAEEWYPPRIAFGKHKGRLIQEARKDAAPRHWIERLAGSSNARNARMGRWCLRELEVASELQTDGAVFASPEIENGVKQSAPFLLEDFCLTARNRLFVA